MSSAMMNVHERIDTNEEEMKKDAFCEVGQPVIISEYNNHTLADGNMDEDTALEHESFEVSDIAAIVKQRTLVQSDTEISVPGQTEQNCQPDVKLPHHKSLKKLYQDSASVCRASKPAMKAFEPTIRLSDTHQPPSDTRVSPKDKPTQSRSRLPIFPVTTPMRIKSFSGRPSKGSFPRSHEEFLKRCLSESASCTMPKLMKRSNLSAKHESECKREVSRNGLELASPMEDFVSNGACVVKVSVNITDKMKIDSLPIRPLVFTTNAIDNSSAQLSNGKHLNLYSQKDSDSGIEQTSALMAIKPEVECLATSANNCSGHLDNSEYHQPTPGFQFNSDLSLQNGFETRSLSGCTKLPTSEDNIRSFPRALYCSNSSTLNSSNCRANRKVQASSSASDECHRSTVTCNKNLSLDEQNDSLLVKRTVIANNVRARKSFPHKLSNASKSLDFSLVCVRECDSLENEIGRKQPVQIAEQESLGNSSHELFPSISDNVSENLNQDEHARGLHEMRNLQTAGAVCKQGPRNNIPLCETYGTSNSSANGSISLINNGNDRAEEQKQKSREILLQQDNIADVYVLVADEPSDVESVELAESGSFNTETGTAMNDGIVTDEADPLLKTYGVYTVIKEGMTTQLNNQTFALSKNDTTTGTFSRNGGNSSDEFSQVHDMIPIRSFAHSSNLPSVNDCEKSDMNIYENANCASIPARNNCHQNEICLQAASDTGVHVHKFDEVPMPIQNNARNRTDMKVASSCSYDEKLPQMVCSGNEGPAPLSHVSGLESVIKFTGRKLSVSTASEPIVSADLKSTHEQSEDEEQVSFNALGDEVALSPSRSSENKLLSPVNHEGDNSSSSQNSYRVTYQDSETVKASLGNSDYGSNTNSCNAALDLSDAKIESECCQHEADTSSGIQAANKLVETQVTGVVKSLLEMFDGSRISDNERVCQSGGSKSDAAVNSMESNCGTESLKPLAITGEQLSPISGSGQARKSPAGLVEQSAKTSEKSCNLSTDTSTFIEDTFMNECEDTDDKTFEEMNDIACRYVRSILGELTGNGTRVCSKKAHNSEIKSSKRRKRMSADMKISKGKLNVASSCDHQKESSTEAIDNAKSESNPRKRKSSASSAGSTETCIAIDTSDDAAKRKKHKSMIKHKQNESPRARNSVMHKNAKSPSVQSVLRARSYSTGEIEKNLAIDIPPTLLNINPGDCNDDIERTNNFEIDGGNGKTTEVKSVPPKKRGRKSLKEGKISVTSRSLFPIRPNLFEDDSHNLCENIKPTCERDTSETGMSLIETDMSLIETDNAEKLANEGAENGAEQSNVNKASGSMSMKLAEAENHHHEDTQSVATDDNDATECSESFEERENQDQVQLDSNAVAKSPISKHTNGGSKLQKQMVLSITRMEHDYSLPPMKPNESVDLKLLRTSTGNTPLYSHNKAICTVASHSSNSTSNSVPSTYKYAIDDEKLQRTPAVCIPDIASQQEKSPSSPILRAKSRQTITSCETVESIPCSDGGNSVEENLPSSMQLVGKGNTMSQPPEHMDEYASDAGLKTASSTSTLVASNSFEESDHSQNLSVYSDSAEAVMRANTEIVPSSVAAPAINRREENFSDACYSPRMMENWQRTGPGSPYPLPHVGSVFQPWQTNPNHSGYSTYYPAWIDPNMFAYLRRYYEETRHYFNFTQTFLPQPNIVRPLPTHASPFVNNVSRMHGVQTVSCMPQYPMPLGIHTLPFPSLESIQTWHASMQHGDPRLRRAAQFEVNPMVYEGNSSINSNNAIMQSTACSDSSKFAASPHLPCVRDPVTQPDKQDKETFPSFNASCVSSRTTLFDDSESQKENVQNPDHSFKDNSLISSVSNTPLKKKTSDESNNHDSKLMCSKSTQCDERVPLKTSQRKSKTSRESVKEKVVLPILPKQSKSYDMLHGISCKDVGKKFQRSSEKRKNFRYHHSDQTDLPSSILSERHQREFLKRSGEFFVQDASCCDISKMYGVETSGPTYGSQSWNKCRECRTVRQTDGSAVFCRFYGFRKLNFKDNVLCTAGFLLPEECTDRDLQLWLPQANCFHEQLLSEERDIFSPNDPLDEEMSGFILANIAKRFCDIVRIEKRAMSWIVADEVIFWKKPVAGVRELCDVCETTLFNLHWICKKCGYGVCLDCYERRMSKSIKEQDRYDSDRRNCFRWARCVKGKNHFHSQMLPTQIIPSTCLVDLCDMMHKVCANHNVAVLCRCEKKSKKPRKDKKVTTKKHSRDQSSVNTVETQSERKKSNSEGVPSSEKTESNSEPREVESNEIDSGAGQRPSIRLIDLLEKSTCKKPCSEIPSSRQDNGPDQSQASGHVNKDLTADQQWLCGGRLLQLKDSQHPANMDLFKKHWKQGMPVLVSGVGRYLNMELWHPDRLSHEYGDENSKNSLVNCVTGSIITNMKIRDFWDGFENISQRLLDEDDKTMILKLKDWPPTEAFNDVMPEMFEDLMHALPLPEYTYVGGRCNLASRLPHFFVKPDLGPKMYNAYGWVTETNWKQGTTNLHLDISDAVNVMVYVGIPLDEPEEAQERLIQIVNEGEVDEIQHHRALNEKPGALWHIFHQKDVDKIRKFIKKVCMENGEMEAADHDPIHDQQMYLDKELRHRLREEYDVEGYGIVQCEGDGVFIPAGAPHQVFNLHSCIKIAEDFVSPEHVDKCFTLTNEFRYLSSTHSNHEDKLQIKNIIYHAVKDIVSSSLHKHCV